MARFKILLADDYAPVRDGLRVLLEMSGDAQVLGEAADGREAVRLAETLGPDVVLMDMEMPNLGGLEATRQIKKARPQTKIVILSMHDDRQYVAEAMRAGASGYLLKDAASSELLAAVKAVAAGSVYLSTEISEVALGDQVDRTRNEPAPTGLANLSGPEREVLQLIAEGKTGPEIARGLCISVDALDSHRRHIMETLEIRNVVDLVKFAIRHGLAPAE